MCLDGRHFSCIVLNKAIHRSATDDFCRFGHQPTSSVSGNAESNTDRWKYEPITDPNYRFFWGDVCEFRDSGCKSNGCVLELRKKKMESVVHVKKKAKKI